MVGLGDAQTENGPVLVHLLNFFNDPVSLVTWGVTQGEFDINFELTLAPLAAAPQVAQE